MSIPRRLHQIWLGPAPVPVRWAERWRRRHRRWAYRLWREADIEAILADALRPAWSHFLATSNWHGAADVARVAILLRDGGVYVDIDSEPVRAFDGAPFMGGSFFAGLEIGTPDAPVHLTNGVIGAEAGHPILVAYARRIAEAEVIEPPWKTVGGGFLTQVVLTYRDHPGVAILPVRTFYPEDKNGVEAPGRDTIYARQYWATTHRLYPYEEEGWRTLARRRRGEPLPDPLPVRLRSAASSAGTRVGQAATRLGRVATRPLRSSWLRRAFRRAIPRTVRRLGRDSIAWIRHRRR